MGPRDPVNSSVEQQWCRTDGLSQLLIATTTSKTESQTALPKLGSTPSETVLELWSRWRSSVSTSTPTTSSPTSTTMWLFLSSEGGLNTTLTSSGTLPLAWIRELT